MILLFFAGGGDGVVTSTAIAQIVSARRSVVQPDVLSVGQRGLLMKWVRPTPSTRVG